MRPAHLALLLTCAAPLAACTKVPPAALAPTLPVYVDDALVGRVPLSVLARPVSLANVLDGPAADARTWRSIDGEGADGRTLHLRKPAEEFADQEARLYRDAQGRTALGMFRDQDPRVPVRLRAMTAQPTASLVGITAIRIRTQEVVVVAAAGADAGALELIVDGVARPLGMGDLSPLPRTKAPIGPRSPAWDLRDVASLSGPAGRTRGLRLQPTEGEAVTLDAATLARPDRLAILKINRKGQRKVRVYEVGATPRMLLEVADVRSIVIL